MGQEVRILGGYAVVPTAATLRAISNDTQRLHDAVEAVEAVKKLLATLTAVVDDSALALRDKKKVHLISLARRMGVSIPTVSQRLAARRAALSGGRNAAAHRLLDTKNTAA